MTPEQHLVLFWVFVGLFVLIGIVALLANIGVVKSTSHFQKWSVGVFFAGVVAVVFFWARSELSMDFYVNLKSPVGVDTQTFELVSGKFEYYGSAEPDGPSSTSGIVELTVGQEIGLWVAKFPSRGVSNAVKLTLKDNTGSFWKVGPFYPNHTVKSLTKTQEARGDIDKLVPAPSSAISAFAGETKTKINNYARLRDKRFGKTYYDWRVFVDEPESVLNGIAEVQYLLHPSFAQPLQVRTNPADKFAVEASGWGQFLIQITIVHKDKSIEKTKYFVNFAKAWPSS